MSTPADSLLGKLLAVLLDAHDDKGRVPIMHLRRQFGLPLTDLMRALSTLMEAKLVELTRLPDQNIAAALTEAGLGLARQNHGLRLEAQRKTVR
ncbi:hypothetical protein [Variovorax ginsengisoli]|uniref:Transcriptional regulator n=1 Tax=Variovorax ginsengisoli TaxID=363844 RepID=A0ABT8SDM2_9BURK|nr:hypothetical protein [Variovorax ginsengisoli]MDN8617763.1 hypothetical protein [Variovorax ginsengisoli]MDO1536933.1 hypothetical protein [Variovorax ginsengisoli]